MAERMPADGHPPEAELARAIDALLAGKSDPLDAGIAGHVEGCPSCQEQILDVLSFLSDPRAGLGPEMEWRKPPRHSRSSFVVRTALRLAAAAIVLVLLATIRPWLPRRAGPEPPPPAASGARPAASLSAAPDRTPEGRPGAGEPARGAVPRASGALTPPPSEKLREIDPFAVNPNLEPMVGSRSRGSAIEILSPPDHALLNGEILFAWHDSIREPFVLTIVNNRNQTVSRFPVGGDSFLFQESLPAGCYYWKLESANELHHVGKFFVGKDPTAPEG